MQDNKQYSPYHGMLPTALLLIAVPVVFVLLLEVMLATFSPRLTYVNAPSARFVGCAMGLLFHLSCIIGGLLRPSFRAFTFRISEFFQNLRCSLGFALRCYWDDIKQDGVTFDVYLAIILANIGYGLYNLYIALELLHVI